MTADRSGRLTVVGDGSVAPGAALLGVRLTAAGALDPGFGSGGRSVAPGLRNDSTTTCGATPGPGGATTAGVASFLGQITAGGAPDTRFAPAGLLRIRTPGGVDVNAVLRPSCGRVVAAGSAGSALYVGRFLA